MINDAVVYRPKQKIAGVRPFFMLPSQGSVDYFDSCGGAPEAELITWAQQFLNPYRDFIDVGSHVGTWGITYKTGGHAKVTAFEAQPWLARLANAGYALNGFSQHCHDFGLWNENDLRPLCAPYADGGGGSIVNTYTENAPAILERVVVKKLDQFHWLDPAFIKIDVEGAELQVLEGATQTILMHQPKILFECWRDERGQNIEDLFSYLHNVLEYKTTNVIGWPEMYLGEPK